MRIRIYQVASYDAYPLRLLFQRPQQSGLFNTSDIQQWLKRMWQYVTATTLDRTQRAPA